MKEKTKKLSDDIMSLLLQYQRENGFVVKKINIVYVEPNSYQGVKLLSSIDISLELE